MTRSGTEADVVIICQKIGYVFLTIKSGDFGLGFALIDCRTLARKTMAHPGRARTGLWSSDWSLPGSFRELVSHLAGTCRRVDEDEVFLIGLDAYLINCLNHAACIAGMDHFNQRGPIASGLRAPGPVMA